MLHEIIKQIVAESINDYMDGAGSGKREVTFEIEIPKNDKFGDYSTNAALILSKELKSNPRELASGLADIIRSKRSGFFKNVEIAGPGFINFHLEESVFINSLTEIYRQGESWGKTDAGSGTRVLIEFVSANPTGYLHFGHARNAAVGDSLARIMEFAGFEVYKEFYINDAGRQMELLGQSVLTRYRQLGGIEAEIPEDGYRGEYIEEIAVKLKEEKGDELLEMDDGEAVSVCADFAYKILLEEIKNDLNSLRVEFDGWYSESEEIHGDSGKGLKAMEEKLKADSCIYENEGATWFRASDYGDSQDWVLIKSDGSPTYFFSDIVYHYDKINRGYQKLINVWGADHHSHVSRLRSAIKALNKDESILEVLLIQFVRLIREGKEVSMSKREGSFVTLREVLDEVGCDVTRFFLLMRGTDTHLDFDLDLAKEQSSDNPVFYIQYAHARIESVLKKAAEENFEPSEDFIDRLRLKDEMDIVKKLLNFPEVVVSSSIQLSPHKIAFYLLDLASDFHVYYNSNKIITGEKELTSARLYFILCIQIVIRNGLELLGISAPRRM